MPGPDPRPLALASLARALGACFAPHELLTVACCALELVAAVEAPAGHPAERAVRAARAMLAAGRDAMERRIVLASEVS